MYKQIILPLLFRFDAEQVHHFVCAVLKFAFKIPGISLISRQLYQYENPVLEREVFGLKFKNPVGLAAGFDKNAELVEEMADLGFGFVEIGTVTPLAQAGNEKPRLFRLKPDHALINRMGFNNEGAKAAAERLRKRKTNILIGGNVGKNKLTPNENALDDYLQCFDALYDVVDYFVVNVSSPNTPGLRDLQEKEPLMKILSALKVRSDELGTVHSPQSTVNGPQSMVNGPQSMVPPSGVRGLTKPILLKIAPDLTNSQLDDIIEIVTTTQIAGVIATNTTISRANLETDGDAIQKIGAGGLSGKPLTYRSTEVIRYICERSNNAFPVIGVGGVASPEDALEKLRAGASLVQIYTGFIYEGPGLAKRICKQLVNVAY
ncbi:MAG: quinone-dependent dihydroorotate dehydrogenase [Cytophagia bacterium]|nr:MAG: quinone-dependent dihydroorotate dehydrogenase [Runella sp.]TAG23014.1 MAG: quinone-dependent dihydroorotate dehydrogenase [Cytophagales bacterium]TAG42066.1 MAG: quinone-dependent dihydroorotate dehydrogenase [Cytophagia bacterium]TAG50717.1 MAG: quinone-dependent dihydroorotate dehydrogenase [Runella slithyformis]TAG83762.1 MAG: quinone-dependent dihydroorotate dehydrogenase [Cytophagales bacterium]